MILYQSGDQAKKNTPNPLDAFGSFSKLNVNDPGAIGPAVPIRVS
ncbi:hypothetical protein MICAC_1400012 [Microcystis aeruginosa PCC 9443]|uniref:Uncharacterized protein n=1 Tax=Microcystis aeruginosa PCC 9443 TaxID=1160281 RepID=I4FZ31_MICAE|nr:hypothetical protein MICAC_1400012 [Microcystis aeruginosa PCC 9443]